MYQYRHVIVRMRLGESDRAIAKTGLMGRLKCGVVRQVAITQGWLEKECQLPADDVLVQQFKSRVSEAVPLPAGISKVELYRDEVIQGNNKVFPVRQF